jgi:hypothetical protein
VNRHVRTTILEGSASRAIVSLAVPIILGNILQTGPPWPLSSRKGYSATLAGCDLSARKHGIHLRQRKTRSSRRACHLEREAAKNGVSMRIGNSDSSAKPATRLLNVARSIVKFRSYEQAQKLAE